MKPGALRSFLFGWCEIIDGLGRVLSFGTLHLNISFDFLAWAEIRYLKRGLNA